MPDIRKWIEAQLKKGYSASHIKAFLSSHGYPPKAVAEVDKINLIQPYQKTYNKNPSHHIAISLLAVIIAIAVVISIYSGYSGIEETPKPASTIAPKDENTILQQFMQENLMSDYQPDSLNISKLPSPTNRNGAAGISIYGAEWDGKWRNLTIKFSSVVQYNPDNKEISHYGVSIQMPMVLDVLNESNAYSIHGIFFKNEDINWTCGKIREANTCEIIKMSEDNAKRADALRESPENLILLSRYNYPLTSEIYENI